MTGKYYRVGVLFNTQDADEQNRAEKWLTAHRNIMIGNDIGCFTGPQVSSESFVQKDGSLKEGVMISYELRDEQAFDRYVSNWATAMRNDPERPECIEVVFRSLSPATRF